MIVFDKVSLHYHYEEFSLLKKLSFTLTEGVNTILCGAQGGKTSICKLLCNQVEQNSGKITLNGISINATKDNGVLHLPQNPTFFEGKSVEYNVAYPLKVRKVVKLQRQMIAQNLAQQFCLPLKSKAKTLNSQQRKNLALARGLTVDRKVVLFDDFFEDASQMQQVFDLFPDAIKVVLTSRLSFAVGNVVVVDCGESVYQGDVMGARQVCQDILAIEKE